MRRPEPPADGCSEWGVYRRVLAQYYHPSRALSRPDGGAGVAP